MKPRKIPMRMCLGCGEMKPKKDLIRAVKSPEGDISLDFGGKAAGRGAYICNNAECIKKAEKTGVLSRALDADVDNSVYEHLKKGCAECD